MTSALEIVFAEHTLVLDGSGALYWPQERILVVSDLHFEKASFLAQHGSFIAPYDTLDTLERLDALITQYQPRELILLGDSFHDRNAWARLDADLRERLMQVMGRVDHCRWIEGNHDVLLAAHGLPAFEVEHTRNGIVFRHEYAAQALPQIIGHYHPKASISLGRQRVRAPCFAHSQRLLVMPAFGSFTGGLNIETPAFTMLFDEPIQPYLLYRQRIYKVAKQDNSS